MAEWLHFTRDDGYQLSAQERSELHRELVSDPRWTADDAPESAAADAGEVEEEPEDLSSLKRSELDVLAAEKGVEDPQKYGSKAEVIDAIREA